MNVVIILLASFPFFIDELLLVLVWSLRPQHFRLTGAIPCINRSSTSRYVSASASDAQ